MTTDPRETLRTAGAEYQAIRASLTQARDHLTPAILAALRDGVPQTEVIALTGLARESVRTIARNGGLEGAGPGPQRRK